MPYPKIRYLPSPYQYPPNLKGKIGGLFGYSGIKIPTHPNILDISYIQWIY
jgi:hypothetical protein